MANLIALDYIAYEKQSDLSYLHSSLLEQR